jgi:hypothetical protein
MSYMVEGLGVIENAPSKGFTKATIKARLSNSFAIKEMKTKQVQPWLHLIQTYMET